CRPGRRASAERSSRPRGGPARTRPRCARRGRSSLRRAAPSPLGERSVSYQPALSAYDENGPVPAPWPLQEVSSRLRAVLDAESGAAFDRELTSAPVVEPIEGGRTI